MRNRSGIRRRIWRKAGVCALAVMGLAAGMTGRVQVVYAEAGITVQPQASYKVVENSERIWAGYKVTESAEQVQASQAVQLQASDIAECAVEVSETDQRSEAEFREPVELTVFAAASLTETLTEIAERYEAEAPGVTLIFNFDSSGTLKTQLEEGTYCDLFLSAAQKQMDQIDGSVEEEQNPEGLDLIYSATRVNLLENRVVLAVPDGNPASVGSFMDLASDQVGLICLGNEDVPVGQYSVEILEALGILEELEQAGKITYGSNVKEVTTQIKEGLVDCGLVYATDAASAVLTVVEEAESELCRPVIYPAAVLKASEHPVEAKAFLDYLQTEEAEEIFQSVGFAMAE